MANESKSRLDREIDEILEKKSKEPIKFKSHPRVKQQHGPSQPEIWQQKLVQGWQWLQRMPLAMAYVFAFIAVLVDDASPLLALLLSAAAVASLWVPGIRRLMGHSQESQPDVKYWRGRPYTQQAKSAVSRHPIDSLKRYFDRNR